MTENSTLYTASPSLARLAEPPAEPVSESELSWIWAGQRFPAAALCLVDGRSLRVVNPGRPGLGAGPDFLDAVFEIGGERRSGDVELHVRASFFRAHGHDTDPAYDGVALHVVFRADDGETTRLHNGGLAPVAAFAPWLQGRTEQLQGWLSAQALWTEPCRDAVARLGQTGVRAALRAAGRERFLARSAALAEMGREVGEEEALWRSLLDLMGVGGDREGFRRLAVAFPSGLAASVTAGLAKLEAQALLAQALVHAAGLGPAPLDCPAALPRPLLPVLKGSGRPANRPERRLAGVAALVTRARIGLAAFTLAGVRDAEDARALVAAWTVPSPFGAALIGPDRARELALNLALPFAASQTGLRDRALTLAEAFPAADAYGKTAFLEANLRPPEGKRLVRGALEQQGLLAYLASWCSKGGCGTCGLSPESH